MKQQFGLRDIGALIIDIDGTLLRGSLPMPGLEELFAFLRSRRISFVVASNNATKTPARYQRMLFELGAEIEIEKILTAAVVTAGYLKGELPPGASLYMIGEAALQEALCQVGFDLQNDASQPAEAVVVGGDSSLTYEKLKYAALLLQRGARFVGTNPDLLCPTEEGLVPEAGTTLAALQAATGLTPTVIGKPARYFFDMAVERIRSAAPRAGAGQGLGPSSTAVLGDRLETDILGGQKAGLRTILVTTGVDDERTVVQKGIEPDLVVSGLDVLVALWQGQREKMNDEEAADESP